MWSWRDSNSRPNEELICFLHAYLRLHFRAAARPKPPTATLFPEFSLAVRDIRQAISDISAPPVRIASKPRLPGDVSSKHLV
ncbi:hypothetical protein TF3313_2499 [Tannerella forsythia 3313]|nr:hypothetical protein TF3313_2499 [Tannerella forsythia 3313]